MTLNGHRVRVKLSLDPFRTDVRAILELPESGPVREAFLSYLEAQDAPPVMVLEWSAVEGDGKPPVHYRVEGKTLNTQFPEAQQAIFQNYEQRVGTWQRTVDDLHHNKSSVIVQREISVDAPSFSTALVAAMRQDPDVIMIGEIRDYATAAAAVSAAQTGHLVLSTLHTIDTVRTVGLTHD